MVDGEVRLASGQVRADKTEASCNIPRLDLCSILSSVISQLCQSQPHFTEYTLHETTFALQLVDTILIHRALKGYKLRVGY